ncbi:MAG: DUF1326 domain-containing protein [Planctomycetales bacterium]|nr:DUF1326 domain-containing protein [Planctomycetales bacterium]
MRDNRVWSAWLVFVAACLPGILSAATPGAKGIRGTYLETRTCQVYTGPCFANAETGIAGRDAIMGWNIESGSFGGVDLSGLSAVVVVRSEKTLGFRGLSEAGDVRSVVYLDERASERQREALLAFARKHSDTAGQSVVRVQTAPIAMKLDVTELTGELTAGKEVTIKARRARLGDCICSNEAAYYPPLAKVENFAPGVTLEGSFQGRGLGSRWSTPGDRSAYLATFAY